MREALLVVDVQRDFCPGGALAVDRGDEVVPGLNDVIGAFARLGLPVFFTRDWHPPDHVSFRSRGGRWPPHCIAGSEGAQFHPRLTVPRGAVIVSKGTSPEKEAYSGFQGTDLEARLKKEGADEVLLGGLTTDYCVKESALDALKAGFHVTLLEDCVRAVDARPGDGERALAEMKGAGAKSTTAAEVVRRLAGTQQYGHHPGSGQS